MDDLSFVVNSLGNATIDNPIQLMEGASYVSENQKFLYNPFVDIEDPDRLCDRSILFELAGPRSKIYFNPAKTKVAVVTCGGLCPGLNSVIRSLVMGLWYRYGVKNIVGIPYGYNGLGATSAYDFIELNPQKVNDIHLQGGTIIGSSRGTPPVSDIVDTLEKYNINILFTIGGDGTLRGAQEIFEEISSRNLKIAIVGIPKTIDNDIPYVKRSFGFETSVSVASSIIITAHEEARSAQRGVGIVKLMGRYSGYIAANTTLATGHVNFCLIPEIPFSLEGDGGLLKLLEKRLEKTDHALIVVAEGAGQHFFTGKTFGTDASGNKKLGDIGVYLKDQILNYFNNLVKKPVNVRYIDPSYVIRSTPANPHDNLFCSQLARNAVHAAMAGKTGLFIGYWHGVMTHVPCKAICGKKQQINPKGKLWFDVLETTGQPINIG